MCKPRLAERYLHAWAQFEMFKETPPFCFSGGKLVTNGQLLNNPNYDFLFSIGVKAQRGKGQNPKKTI